MNGKIKWYKQEKGYGFITGDDGKDYFVHHSNLPQEQQDVRESDDINVSFEVKNTDRGTQATEITILKKEASSEESSEDDEE